MKTQEIKFNDQNKKYSILIGNNVLKILPKKIKSLCLAQMIAVSIV